MTFGFQFCYDFHTIVFQIPGMMKIYVIKEKIHNCKYYKQHR